MLLFRLITIITGVLIAVSLTLSVFYFFEIRQIDRELERVNAEEAGAEYRLALITEQMDHEYWHIVEEGVQEAGEELNIEVKYLGTRRTNYDEQSKMMDMQIAGGVDGIIVQAVNEAMFQPLIDKAVDRGIPVLTIDTDAPSSNRASYIGTDNYEAGYAAGTALADDLDGSATVAIITNSLTSTHQKLRVEGFEDAVDEYDQIDIVTVAVSNNTRIEAEQEAAAIINQHEDVDAFYGTSALDGIGIADALEGHRREEDIYTVAFDSLDETLSLLNDGAIDTIIAQQPYEMGYRSVVTMKGILEGLHYPSIQHTSVDVITLDNVSDFPFDGRKKP
ncbi:sugar-binding protein [Salisediminibacterium beveridgei]|uniref:Sugar ABC transporter (Sugar-binding protein) n=1 Tax=Salisediminibacterium beveridgei TaxID=632773 RepID=A0A1D7QRF8_9BACI|nr:sugar-binding protein [Salisediminibacterium beveridgei]AOM81586.1 sugar ABC transporter (sugar-binding protein) [Salisediminibacterium beveridgei]